MTTTLHTSSGNAYKAQDTCALARGRRRRETLADMIRRGESRRVRRKETER